MRRNRGDPAVLIYAGTDVRRKGRLEEFGREFESDGDRLPALRTLGFPQHVIPIQTAIAEERSNVADGSERPTLARRVEREVQQEVVWAESTRRESAGTYDEGALRGPIGIEGRKVGRRELPVQVHLGRRIAANEGDFDVTGEIDIEPR